MIKSIDNKQIFSLVGLGSRFMRAKEINLFIKFILITSFVIINR